MTKKVSMLSLVEKIDKFDDAKEDWTQYVENMDHFFGVNEIADTDRNCQSLAVLVVIGSAAYMLVSNLLVSPTKPGEKSYDELVKALKDHFNPSPSKTVQR